jgi:hypothetical protein
MKKTLLSLIIITAGFAATAQELAPDQNPNYKVSMDKYTAIQTSETSPTAMNTTVQQTYKAYDWRTAKDEKKAERRAERRENRLFNNYNQNYYQPYNYDGRNNYGRPYRYNNYNRWRW